MAVTASGLDGVRPDLEEIFRRNYSFVVGVAARVLGSVDHAEDVAQEAFLSFNRSSVPRTEARAWLSVAAAHTALNEIRSRKRRGAREENVAAGGGRLLAEDAADAVVALDEQARVRSALRRLPRSQAVVLLLRHSGLSYAEIAAALDLAPGSVGTTLRRAEMALRKELEPDATRR